MRRSISLKTTTISVAVAAAAAAAAAAVTHRGVAGRGVWGVKNWTSVQIYNKKGNGGPPTAQQHEQSVTFIQCGSSSMSAQRSTTHTAMSDVACDLDNANARPLNGIMKYFLLYRKCSDARVLCWRCNNHEKIKLLCNRVTENARK